MLATSSPKTWTPRLPGATGWSARADWSRRGGADAAGPAWGARRDAGSRARSAMSARLYGRASGRWGPSGALPVAPDGRAPGFLSRCAGRVGRVGRTAASRQRAPRSLVHKRRRYSNLTFQPRMAKTRALAGIAGTRHLFVELDPQNRGHREDVVDMTASAARELAAQESTDRVGGLLDLSRATLASWPASRPCRRSGGRVRSRALHRAVIWATMCRLRRTAVAWSLSPQRGPTRSGLFNIATRVGCRSRSVFYGLPSSRASVAERPPTDRETRLTIRPTLSALGDQRSSVH